MTFLRSLSKIRKNLGEKSSIARGKGSGAILMSFLRNPSKMKKKNQKKASRTSGNRLTGILMLFLRIPSMQNLKLFLEKKKSLEPQKSNLEQF